MHVIKISVSLSTKQNEWPINDDFCNYTAIVHEFWPQKKNLKEKMTKTDKFSET